MVSGILARLRALIFRRAWDAELDEEIRYHVEREIERNLAKGMSVRDARDAARRQFGNVTVATETARDTSRWFWLEEITQNIRYAIRGAARAPAFTATLIGTIGIGIASAVTAFAMVHALFFR